MAVDLKRAYERNAVKESYTPPPSVDTCDGKTAKIVTNTYVLLHIDNMREPVIFCPSKRMTLGRWHDATPRKPDIDLEPYGARENGVSRIHAAIQMQDDNVTVKDMGSSNGTRVNGLRVQPGQFYVLSDGDEIRLGRLAIKVGIKVKTPTSQDTMDTDETDSVLDTRRRMGAGVLRPITPLVAQDANSRIPTMGDDDTLIMSESGSRRPNGYKLPDFVSQLDQNNRQVRAQNLTSAAPSQAKPSVIKPLSRQSVENPKPAVTMASQGTGNRGTRVIRPLSTSTPKTSVPVEVQQVKPQNRGTKLIRPLSDRSVEMPITTDR